MKSLLVILMLMCVGSSSAQNTEILTNKSIIELKKAGLATSTVKSAIANAPCNFTLDTKSLIELKNSGVPEEIINAMIDKMAGSNQKNSEPIANTDTSRISTMLKDGGSGVYYLLPQEKKLQEMEPTVYSQAKQGSGILTNLTYGIAKTKAKMALSGDKANLQITEQKPTFYFYFTTEKNSLSVQPPTWFNTASSPNEFMLVKFDISNGKSKKTREVTTGSFNSYAGMSSGVDEANKKPFKYKKLQNGIYEVYFETPLESGEYCFMYAGTVNEISNPKVYDFGIH